MRVPQMLLISSENFLLVPVLCQNKNSIRILFVINFTKKKKRMASGMLVEDFSILQDSYFIYHLVI